MRPIIRPIQRVAQPILLAPPPPPLSPYLTRPKHPLCYPYCRSTKTNKQTNYRHSPRANHVAPTRPPLEPAIRPTSSLAAHSYPYQQTLLARVPARRATARSPHASAARQPRRSSARVRARVLRAGPPDRRVGAPDDDVLYAPGLPTRGVGAGVRGAGCGVAPGPRGRGARRRGLRRQDRRVRGRRQGYLVERIPEVRRADQEWRRWWCWCWWPEGAVGRVLTIEE